MASSSRVISPISRPNSAGRPALSPCQKGILPGSPGAGVTVTRSWVIWAMRQVVAPRMMVSPARLSKTISSSSSPTRAPRVAPARETVNKPRSGMVPPLMTATERGPRGGGWVGDRHAGGGDGAAVDDGHGARALARGELVGDAVPGEARAEFGELVGGVAAGQHIEDRI